MASMIILDLPDEGATRCRERLDGDGLRRAGSKIHQQQTVFPCGTVYLLTVVLDATTANK
jgi:hypothetical protein